MSGMKSLAKDTAVYGLSSIVGRFLNWCLVPLYTHVFAQAEYGVVTYLYSLVAHFIGSRFVGRSPLCVDACRYIGHRCVYLFAVCLPAL